MIRQVCDPEVVNGFANHPDIGSEMDLSAGIREPNVHLYGEHGGISWMWCGPGVFEAHVMFTKAGRGLWGIRSGRQAIAIMAGRGARVLWARVHPDRPEIGVFAAASGMKDTGMRLDFDFGDGRALWRIFEWRP